MRKNILEVCLSPSLGGLELFAYHCYKTFNVKTTCKIVLEKDKKLDRYFESDDKIYIKRNKLFPFFPALKLAKYIDENNIDILHFHWTKDILTVVLAKLISRKKPQLVQSRHMGMTRFKDDYYHRFLYKNLIAIHAITNLVSEQLTKYIPKKVLPEIKVIYLGVKPKNSLETLALEKKYNLINEFVVGIIGRIEEKKGQHKVIEAISILKDLDIKLLIVGHSMDDAYVARLYRDIKSYHIEDKVIFSGFTKEVDAHMQLCDVTVLATENEAFGLVVIESMANKTPVIATNRGGPLEIIDDGINGILYDGTSHDLAQKIGILYKNINLKEKLAQKSYEKVKEQFDFDKQLIELYSFITKEKNNETKF